MPVPTMKQPRVKVPKLVLISDIHFSLKTLKFATLALDKAIAHAKQLCVPLVICGDLNDTKAIIRAEVANVVIDRLKTALNDCVDIRILIGNHDLINEKGTEHSLNFLEDLSFVISVPTDMPEFYAIPYQSDITKLREIVKSIPKRKLIIMHQGFQGAKMGHYVKDTSSIEPDSIPNKVFSGHYHEHQTIGTVTYIGNPYSLGYGEASHPDKGMIVVYKDNSFDLVPLNISKHLDCHFSVDAYLNFVNDKYIQQINKVFKPEFLGAKVRISGTEEQLKCVEYNVLKDCMGLDELRLDLVPTDKKVTTSVPNITAMTDQMLLDEYIDQSDASNKDYLKDLWRKLK